MFEIRLFILLLEEATRGCRMSQCSLTFVVYFFPFFARSVPSLLVDLRATYFSIVFIFMRNNARCRRWMDKFPIQLANHLVSLFPHMHIFRPKKNASKENRQP